jgi:hypothetical protein
MLHFFRHIRRSFFPLRQEGSAGHVLPGKVRTYLAYAFGEIILIVVGILLALQISEWNQARKDRAEEQEILSGLKSEFENHHRVLTRGSNLRKNQLSRISQFMSHIKNQEEALSIAELDEALYFVLLAYTWDPSNSVLDALIASGKLELIQDSELRRKLASWDRTVKVVRESHLTIGDFNQSTLWPFLASKGAPLARGWGFVEKELQKYAAESSAEMQYKNIQGDQEIIDMISTNYVFISRSVSEMDRANQTVEEIITLIEKNIR